MPLDLVSNRRTGISDKLYMPGAQLIEAYPVAPIAQVHELPSALDVALGELVPDLAAAPAPAAVSAG